MGIKTLINQLNEAGYEISIMNDFVVFRFIIPVGRFLNKKIEVALQAPQFPEIPPSGPHIKPHLLPISGGGGIHPTGGIHASPIGSEFQYWSRPFHGWNESNKDVYEYLAHLRTIFDFE